MTDITGIIVVIVSIACMLLASRKRINRQTRVQYSLMGSATAVLIAVEAARRAEFGVMSFFVLAAAFSVLGLVVDHLKASKPDA